MKNKELSLPGKRLYQPPVSEEFVLATEQMLCMSGDMDGSTEVWEEITLIPLEFDTIL